jgi:hypothetical protein
MNQILKAEIKKKLKKIQRKSISKIEMKKKKTYYAKRASLGDLAFQKLKKKKEAHVHRPKAARVPTPYFFFSFIKVGSPLFFF